MTIRSAMPEDVDFICRIIGHYASEGLMLPRSKSAVTASLPSYLVADIEGEVVGCGGLHPYTPQLAEIYGLATSPKESPHGTGRAIVQGLVEKARGENISKVFALTLVPGFFEKMGFRTVPHRELPQKVWKDCIACPKFGNCDEVAMVLEL